MKITDHWLTPGPGKKYRQTIKVRTIKKRIIMKKLLVPMAIILFAFACSENNDVMPQSLTSKRDLAIAAAVEKLDPTRVNKVTQFLFHEKHNPASPLLKEFIAINKVTGKKSLAYAVMNETTKETSSARTACGSISGGWILSNDGCWYHGTLIVGCNGVSIFVVDANPYLDDYIGNEPHCMGDDEFDSIA
jgi:hypothetical protein